MRFVGRRADPVDARRMRGGRALRLEFGLKAMAAAGASLMNDEEELRRQGGPPAPPVTASMEVPATRGRGRGGRGGRGALGAAGKPWP